MGKDRRFARSMVAAIGATALAAGVAPAAHADGVAVVKSLGGASAATGPLTMLTGTVGANGRYSEQTYARQVPFLGTNPTEGPSGLFRELDKIGEFGSFAPQAGAKASVIVAKVQEVDNAISGDADELGVPTCDGVACADQPLSSVEAVRVRLDVRNRSPRTGDREFSGLGLDALNRFLPKGVTTKLKADLGWRIQVDLVATATSVAIEDAGASPALELEPKITFAAPLIKFDVGVLRLEATPTGTPGFSGKLLVDFDGSDVRTARFGFENGLFDGRWKLALTEDSPLQGLSSELHIRWPLNGAGIDPAELTVDLEQISLDAGKLIGDDLNKAAAQIREITHPIRTATGPLIAPLPGLSQLSGLLGGEKITALHLAQLRDASGAKSVRAALETLAAIDDGLAFATGGPGVGLGKISLGRNALTADALPPDLTGLDQQLDLCAPCRDAVQALGKANPSSGGFDFKLPLLDDPSSIAKLLLGQDVDIFTFDTKLIRVNVPVLSVPVASVAVFSVSLGGRFDAGLRIAGGFDTKGMREVIEAGGNAGEALANGLFLKRTDDPVLSLGARVGLEAVVAHIAGIFGGVKTGLDFNVPLGLPDDKLRPATVEDGIACALLAGSGANVSFVLNAFVQLPFVGRIEQNLVDLILLELNDLCGKSNPVELADIEGGVLKIRTAPSREIAPGETDFVKIFSRHDAAGNPTSTVVTTNNNKRQEFPQHFDSVAYTPDPQDPNRRIRFQVARNDGRPFEKPVMVRGANNDDDISLDLAPHLSASVHLGSGHDKYVGGDQRDHVMGGIGNDGLSGGGGEDRLEGGQGDDTLLGEEGGDNLNGEEGDDIVADTSPTALDGSGRNTLRGGSDDDRIMSGPGADIMMGDGEPYGMLTPDSEGFPGGGADFFVTGGGADEVIGGTGNDRVRQSPDKDAAPFPDDVAKVTVQGNGGEDDIVLGFGPDAAHGGPGDDTIDAGGGNNTVTGGIGFDLLTTREGDDTVSGDDGKDSCSTPDLESIQPVEHATEGSTDIIATGFGRDRVAGEFGNDILLSGPGEDRVCGGAGDDSMSGFGDTDVMWGGSGNESGIHGGDDDDRIYGGPGVDVLSGEAGADLLAGQDENDRLDGGPEGDRIEGGDGSDRAFGRSGDDLILGGGGDDELSGDDDMDRIEGGDGPDVIDGGIHDDVLLGDGHDDTLHGDSGADRIEGGDGLDNASGGDQDDLILGQAGDDELSGDDGADRIEGGDGDDNAFGGAQDDHLLGDNDEDILVGEAGADRLEGGEGADNADGGDQDDLVLGQNGGDTLNGDAGDDRIEGGEGGDTAHGGDANDLVLGQSDADTLTGDDGMDRIEGGDGDDRADGGNDADVVLGQAGDDPALLGGGADDHLEGGPGDDGVQGQHGQDDILGGSSPAYLPDGITTASLGDGGETLLSGGPGSDAIVGDNGRIERPGGTESVDPDDPARVKRVVTLRDLQVGGGDNIAGEEQNDLIFGAAGDDNVNGGPGNDQIEGGQGSDALDGDVGADDVIGGSSPQTLPPGMTTAQLVDVGDRLVAGGGGADALLGDNGSIEHVVGTDGKWARTRADGSYVRTITLLERLSGGGGDTMSGGAGNDRMFGALGNDVIHAGIGTDFAEGNQGADTIAGSAGDDDLVGGTSPQATGGDANAAATTPDGDDTIHGRAPDEPDQIPGSGLVVAVDVDPEASFLLRVRVRYGPVPEPPAGTEADDDVVLGDNARVDRCKPTGEGTLGLTVTYHGRDQCTWTKTSLAFYGPATARYIQPLGQATPVVGLLGQLGVGSPNNRAGKDAINGNDGDDLLLGQDGFDTIHGGAGDDIVYGGLDLNKLYGDGGGVDVVILGPDLSLLKLVGVSV